MNKAVEKLRGDLEQYLIDTESLSLEGLTDAVLKTLSVIETYTEMDMIEKALFRRKED